MREKRKQPRFAENVVVSFENATDVEAVGRGIDEMPCVLTEISEGGGRIRVMVPMPSGTPLLLHLLLDLADEDEVYLRLHARTRWQPDRVAEPPYDIGLEFTDIPQEQLAVLRRYISQKVAWVA